MRTFGIRFFIAGLLCVTSVSACDDDDDGSADAASADGGGGEACLQGAWECTLPDSSTAEMTISGTSISGSFMQASVTATVMSDLTIDGDMLTVVDTGGTGACPSTQMGVYTFTCDASSLSFTQVSDDCMGRSNFFGCEWTKP